MGIKPEPTVDVIVKLIEQVLKKEISREDVADFATYYITNDSIYVIRNEEILRLLDLTSGIDLKDTPTEYLHNDQDLKDWIKKYKKYNNFSPN